MINRKYTTEQIVKAKRMYKQGVSARKIARELGFADGNAVSYHTNPTRKAKMREYAYAWRRKNPERWKELCREAAIKHKKKYG